MLGACGRGRIEMHSPPGLGMLKVVQLKLGWRVLRMMRSRRSVAPQIIQKALWMHEPLTCSLE